MSGSTGRIIRDIFTAPIRLFTDPSVESVVAAEGGDAPITVEAIEAEEARREEAKVPAPTIPDAILPDPITDEDIATGASKLAKRRRVAIGTQERRSKTPVSLLSDDFANTLLGGG